MVRTQDNHVTMDRSQDTYVSMDRKHDNHVSMDKTLIVYRDDKTRLVR